MNWRRIEHYEFQWLYMIGKTRLYRGNDNGTRIEAERRRRKEWYIERILKEAQYCYFYWIERLWEEYIYAVA